MGPKTRIDLQNTINSISSMDPSFNNEIGIPSALSLRYNLSVDPMLVIGASDESLKYFGLHGWYLNDYYSWPDGDPRNGLNGVTVALVDTGLNKQDWIDLEYYFQLVDIIAYVTSKDGGKTIDVFTTPYDPNFYDSGKKEHGSSVLSALGTVARGVKVVFLDLKMYDKELKRFEPYGLYKGDVFKWLFFNGDNYGVQIVSMSITFAVRHPSENVDFAYAMKLYEKNYFMVVSAGNHGTQYNFNGTHYFYSPQNSKYWYTIGSIDYDDIGEFFNSDMYSVKDHWSGSAVYSPLRASWGTITKSHASVDWVMPGNQVPVMSSDPNKRTWCENVRRWYYKVGTSFSTPYFAGIVAILLDGYMDGYRAFGKVAPQLSINKIVDMLIKESSLGYFNYKLGYGFVNAHSIYRLAYNIGYIEARPDTGGGIGPNPI